MLGAIFGDIAGSVYEFNNTHDYNFRLLSRWSNPTDDCYLTLAVAKGLMETYGQDDEKIKEAVIRNMRDIGKRYPHAGYGGMFSRWLREKEPKPYNSFGNGSAMRAAAAGWIYQTLEETLHGAGLTAEVTHNHPEGIKGAQAVAAAVFLARAGADKEQIINYLANHFQYNLFRTLKRIRENYSFDESCQGTVPEALIAFYEGENFEDVIRKAVSLGGDSDTIACIAGAVAEAYYGMPEFLKEEALARLDAPMREIVLNFRSFYRKHSGKPFDGWEREIENNRKDPFLQFNDLIEQRILEFYASSMSDDEVLPILQAILTAMEAMGHVLVPVETPENAEKIFNPEKIKAGDTISTEEELRWPLIHLINEDGKICMPVFTSEDKVEEAEIGRCSILSVFLDDYVDQVTGMENVEGIVVNPGEHSIFLHKEILAFLSEENRKLRMKEYAPGEDAAFMIPDGVPEGLTEVIAEFIGNNLDEVEKVWFTGIKSGNEKSWCFAVKTEAEDAQPIFERIQLVMVMLKVQSSVDYMTAEDTPWPGAWLIYEKESR